MTDESNPLGIDKELARKMLVEAAIDLCKKDKVYLEAQQAQKEAVMRMEDLQAVVTLAGFTVQEQAQMFQEFADEMGQTSLGEAILNQVGLGMGDEDHYADAA